MSLFSCSITSCLLSAFVSNSKKEYKNFINQSKQDRFYAISMVILLLRLRRLSNETSLAPTSEQKQLHLQATLCLQLYLRRTKQTFLMQSRFLAS